MHAVILLECSADVFLPVMSCLLYLQLVMQSQSPGHDGAHSNPAVQRQTWFNVHTDSRVIGCNTQKLLLHLNVQAHELAPMMQHMTLCGMH
jgi:hypothetical protein